MTDNYFTETALVLFWAGYFGLHWWLLRTPDEPAPVAATAAEGSVQQAGNLQGKDYA